MSTHQHSGFVPDPSWPSILELAIKLWGQPTDWSHNRDEARFGSKGSKSIRLSDQTWFDHEAGEGGGYADLHLKAIGPLPRRPEPTNGGGGNVPPWENVGTVYHYHDADGALILDVVRTITGAPRFLQRAPDASSRSGWKWSVKHIPNHDMLLYRLPGLRASGDATVWITEGEKDADRLTDELLIATTGIGGAAKWRAEYADEFRDKPAVILQDNDQAGRDHAAAVARSLIGIAASVKVLLLPGLPAKGDVSDWLDAGGTIAALERLAREAPEYRPEPDSDDATTKPVLHLRYGFDATAAQPIGTIVEGWLHAGSVTLIYGPPKSGKSFLFTDLALAIPDETRDEWMGHAIVRHGPVLYIACEGHAGFWKRLTAAAKARGWHRDTFPKGFILATGRPMLIRVDARGMTYAPDPSSILEALEDAKRRGLDPVAIVIDTVFRSFGAGNVNASSDMNVYLACVAVLTDQGYAVALVHHEIKAGGTPAGSVSLIGGADTILHVWRESETGERRFWQVEMAKDDAETEPRAFTLDVIPIGLDPDGRHASSCVICDGGTAPDAMPKRRGRPPSDNSDAAMLAGAIYTELCNLLADQREGENVSIHPEAAPIRAVNRSRLRATIKMAGILDAEDGEADGQRVAKSNDRRVQRAIIRLKNQGKIAANEHWVGLAK